MNDTFILAGHTVVLTAIEPGKVSPLHGRFQMLVDGNVHERYLLETRERAELVRSEIVSTLESLTVALR